MHPWCLNTINIGRGETWVFQGQLSGVEGQHACLTSQMDSLKGQLLDKSTELEVRERQYEHAQSQLSEAGQKHAKDLENIGSQVAQLQQQVHCIKLCFFYTWLMGCGVHWVLDITTAYLRQQREKSTSTAAVQLHSL